MKKTPHNAGICVAYVDPNLMNCGSAVGIFDVTVNRTRANLKQTLCQYPSFQMSSAEIEQHTASVVCICGDKTHHNIPSFDFRFSRTPAAGVCGYFDTCNQRFSPLEADKSNTPGL